MPRADYDLAEFRDRLRWAISKLEISEAELDDRLGKDISSRWLSGQVKKPRGNNMVALVKALGVERPWLESNEGAPFSPASGTVVPTGTSQPDESMALVSDIVKWLNGPEKPHPAVIARVRKLVAKITGEVPRMGDGDKKE